MSQTQTPPVTASPGILRPGLSLAVIVSMSCLAQFMVVLDTAIVTLALPQMRDGLGLAASQQQWVVSAYLITFGGFLLLAARAGDLLGPRRVFLLGGVVFTAASLAGGLATGPAMLLAARAVQGIGAAALAPTSLSLITVTHADERRRRRAMALWSIMGGAAGTFGVILGGVLTAELSWRWVLFINVPLGAVLVAATAVALLPAVGGVGDEAGGQARLDLPGALTITLGMGALTYGLSQASSDGWGSPSVLSGLVAAAVLLAAFVAAEVTGRRPLIPLALFRLRVPQIGNLVMLGMGVTMTGAFFFLSLYFQEAIGYSALRTGLAMVPMTVTLVAGGFAAGRLIPVIGRRPLILVGGIIAAASLAWLATAPGHPAYLAHILGPSLLAGIGISLMLPPVTLTASVGVDPRHAGAAAGLLNVSRQLGGAIGLAVLGTIAASVTRGDARHASPLAALVGGYHVAFVVSAAVMLAAALVSLALPRTDVLR